MCFSSAFRFPPLPTVRDLLKMYHIRAKKSLSQNFIMDPRILNKIVRCVGDVKDKFVVEIGPGPGGITRALLQADPAKVVVVEKDPRFIPSLKLLQEASGGRSKLDFYIGDCLNFNIASLFPETVKRDWNDTQLPDAFIVGNLPFSVSTPFLIKMLSSMSSGHNYYAFGRVPAVLTFQLEVANRMIALPDSPERSRLSVMCQNYAEIELLYTLPGKAFVPPPAVDVGVVKITPWRRPYICESSQTPMAFHDVNRIVTTLFMGKQRFLISNIARLFPKGDRRTAQQVIDMAQIAHDRNAISLTMNEIERLCLAVKHFTNLNFIDVSPKVSLALSTTETFLAMETMDADVNKPLSRFDIKF